MKLSKGYRPELVVSKDPERPHLLDPYLDAKEDRLLSLNAHSFVALPVETEKGERSRYLAVPLLKAARKMGDEDLPLEIEDQEVVESGVLWPTSQDRTFPAWQDIVPAFHQGDPGVVTVALNARLLAALAGAMGTGGPVRITFDPRLPAESPGAILVQPHSPDPEAYGVLMPLRISDGTEAEDLPEGSTCPTCKKLLAAGAPCPDHGHAKPPIVGGEEAEDAPVLVMEWVGPNGEGCYMARVPGSRFEIGPSKGGKFWVRHLPDVGAAKTLGNSEPTLDAAKTVAKTWALEKLGDRILAGKK